MLCDRCKSIDWDDVFSEGHFFLYMQSISSLRANGTIGQPLASVCSLCALFYNSLLQSIDNDPDMPPVPSARSHVPHNATCDGCNKRIYGIRHKCLKCPDWDYCSTCIAQAPLKHARHPFWAISEPQPVLTRQEQLLVLDHERKVATTAMCQECMTSDSEKPLLVIGNLDRGFLAVLLPCAINFDVSTREGLGRALDALDSPGTLKVKEVHFGKLQLSENSKDVKLSWRDDVRDISHKRKTSLDLSAMLDRRQLIQGWMHECRNNHQDCFRPEEDPAMPTRVIDVGSSEASDVHIIKTNGMPGRWLALSYSWGGAENFPQPLRRDTAINVAIPMPLVSLPELIRDAISVTRELNYRYLWVDSFCVVQGDKDDFEREAPRMADVYRNADITIAAANTDRASGSLSLSRLIQRPVCINISTEGNPSITRWIIPYRQQGPVRKRIEDSLLHTRGWTLQEAHLSVRMVYFDRNELLWQCRGGLTREASPSHFVIAADLHVPRRLFDSFATQPANIFIRWNDLVQSYTSRQLTERQDVMAALSGLAKEFARYISCRRVRQLATPEQIEQIMSETRNSKDLAQPSEMKHGVEPQHPPVNASSAFICEQMELTYRRPMPGYEDRPLRTDPFLTRRLAGMPMKPIEFDGPQAFQQMSDRLLKISNDSGLIQRLDAVFRRHDADRVAAFLALFGDTRALENDDTTIVLMDEELHSVLQSGIEISEYLASEDRAAVSSSNQTRSQSPHAAKGVSEDASRGRSDDIRTNALDADPEALRTSKYDAQSCAFDVSEAPVSVPGPSRTEDNSSRLPCTSEIDLKSSQSRVVMQSNYYVYPGAGFPITMEWPRVAEDPCYLAGLWRAGLPKDLGWYVARPDERLGQYWAPSWSWASLSGKESIHYPRTIVDYVSPDQPTEDFGQDGFVLEARTEVIGHNPFGDVRSGRITLLAKLVDIPFYDLELLDHAWLMDLTCDTDAYPSVPIGAYRDEVTGISPFCKGIFIGQETILLVEPTSNSCFVQQPYRRVGLWEKDGDDMKLLLGDLKHEPRQVVTIF
jgi:hypothetical protein